jgi:5-methylcytosine-specific restriction endonuclease McrA
VDYHEYIRSEAWREKRRDVILRACGVCERCGLWPVVNVHHLTYDRVGNELLEDLLGVCSRCHREFHQGKHP